MTLTGGNGDNGGAIENDTATLTVIESTISGNSAAVDGGGLSQCPWHFDGYWQHDFGQHGWRRRRRTGHLLRRGDSHE